MSATDGSSGGDGIKPVLRDRQFAFHLVFTIWDLISVWCVGTGYFHLHGFRNSEEASSHMTTIMCWVNLTLSHFRIWTLILPI
jgi:hypothetical protein